MWKPSWKEYNFLKTMIKQAIDFSLKLTPTASIPAKLPHARRKVLARKQIWLACTPKSASAYLDKLLTHLLDGEIARNPPVSYWRGRFQEPEIVKFYEGIRFNRKTFFSGHLHVKYSQFIYSQFLRRQADSIPNNPGGGSSFSHVTSEIPSSASRNTWSVSFRG